MSSAETTHAVEWRDDGNGGETALVNGKTVATIEAYDLGWIVLLKDKSDWRFFLRASAARSFVEKSVKEAGHGNN
jgi:hypothetical protein